MPLSPSASQSRISLRYRKGTPVAGGFEAGSAATITEDIVRPITAAAARTAVTAFIARCSSREMRSRWMQGVRPCSRDRIYLEEEDSRVAGRRPAPADPLGISAAGTRSGFGERGSL